MPRSITRRAGGAALLLAGALILSACGGNSAHHASATSPSAEDTSTATGPAPEQAIAAPEVAEVTSSSTLWAGDVCMEVPFGSSWPISTDGQSRQPLPAGGCGTEGTVAVRIPACDGWDGGATPPSTECTDAITEEHLRAMDKAWEADGWTVQPR